MTLPRVNRDQPDPDQTAHLSRWLREWELLQALAPDTPPRPSHTPLALAGAADPNPVQAGDIRLLHPAIEPNGVRYVAVLCQQRGGDFLVAPFGLLSEPATQDEVTTGRTTPALRVLCAWNRFEMCRDDLQRSWLADRLNDEECHTLLTPMVTATATGAATWPADRTGPPLRHPLDPRWGYLEMESEFRQRACRPTRHGVVYDIGAGELRKAAETRTPYGTPADEDEDGDEDRSTPHA